MSDKRVNLDPESQAIIYQGASANQLGVLFGMKPSDVQRRLGDLLPVATGRQGNPLYKVADAAPRLIRWEPTPGMIDSYMKNVNHTQLPPMVNKFYWQALRERERYRLEADELWHTEDVVRAAGDTFQSLRMSLMLVPDILRDEADLNESQFRIVQRIIDDSLEGARARLVTDLRKSGPERSGSEGEEGEV